MIDWEPAEEAKLVRKLDMRVLLPCCIVYFLVRIFQEIIDFYKLQRLYRCGKGGAIANVFFDYSESPLILCRIQAYLDRANMGFVAVLQADTPDSFEESLHLEGLDFNWAVSVTYFMVTVLLIPSNLLMKKISGKRYFPLIMCGFGTIVCCIAATKNAAGLLAARFFLGIPESGVVSLRRTRLLSTIYVQRIR